MDFTRQILIPASFMIVVDDLGKMDMPLEHGDGRRHCVADYEAIIEMGKRLGMRIKCGFILKEWDRKNLLKKVRGASRYGPLWDNSSRLEPSIDEMCRVINDGRDHIEISLHGLSHYLWSEDGVKLGPEFYQRDGDRLKMTSPDMVREHLDAFYEILDQNNLKGDIKSFIPPCFSYTYSPGKDHLSAILKEYGILYISTIFKSMDCTLDEKPIDVGVENGIINVDRTPGFIRWFAVDAKTPKEFKKSYFGLHFANILHQDPRRNGEVIDRWVEYFEMYKNRFDVLPAKNNDEASNQALYRRFTTIKQQDGDVILDFSQVDNSGALGLGSEFRLSVLKGLGVKADDTLSLVKEDGGDNFVRYKVIRRMPHGKISRIHCTYE